MSLLLLFPASGDGPTIIEGDGAASGVAATAVAGVALWATIAASTGAATVQGTATNTEAADGSVVGTATVSGASGATAGSAGSAAGAATVSGTGRKSIFGVTKDLLSLPLAGCTVLCFRTSDNVFLADDVSDAAGNYVVYPEYDEACYLVAYKAGALDVAGTTLNSLTAA
jgi:hypothetical protein